MSKGKLKWMLCCHWIVCCVLAAQEVNFSGKWVLNHEKTLIPDMPDITTVITQDKDRLQHKRIVKSSDGEFLTEMSLDLNGTESIYTDFRGDKHKCSCAMREGRLILSYQSKQKRSGKWVILDIEEEYSLSEDGKTCMVTHAEKREAGGGKWAHPMVFDRWTQNESDSEETAVPSQTVTQPAGNYTKQQLIDDTRQLLDCLENIHPDPYLYSGGKVAFHRRFQNVLQAIPENGMTGDEYNHLLSPFLASIRDAHTGIMTSFEYDREAQGGIPISFRSVEKLIYVQGVILEDHTPLIGAKLLSVQGIPFSDLKQRLSQIEAVENEYAGLFSLSYYLTVKPYLNELIPEWRDFSRISAEFELANGNKQETTFSLPVPKKSAYITHKTKVGLPSTVKCDFGYLFLTPDKKTAILKVDRMTAYREAFESQMRARDLTLEISEAYKKIHGKDAPEAPEEALAGIPSAIEMFKQLLQEMKQAGTENLIVDLSKNPGGHSLMSDILTYFLYGREALIRIIVEETQVRKYSPYFFQSMTGRTLEGINRQYSQIQSYPLTENDYDFSVERYVQLAVTGKLDTLSGLRLKYQENPSFLREIESGTYDQYYSPRNVIVASSNSTFSSAFTFLRYLYKSGAKIAGSASGQSGNGFGNFTIVSLKNTGIKAFISKEVYNVFPETRGERRVLEPYYQLTYEKLKSYDFDPNAEVRYAIEILQTMRR